jgi:hypothetical protein
MSFLAPSAPAAPAPPPPPPAPPTFASPGVANAGASARQAAAAASGGMGFADTLKTSPEGAAAPNVTTGKALTGQ